jgi:hypothetical protein
MKNELCFAFVRQTVAPVMIKTLRGAEEVDAMVTLNTCGRSRKPVCPIVVVLKFEFTTYFHVLIAHMIDLPTSEVND